MSGGSRRGDNEMKNYQGSRPVAPTTHSEPTPFGNALYLARKISSREDDTTALSSAMNRIDDDGKKKLVFRLQKEVLEGKAEVSGIFAAARIAKMMSVAHFTAATRKAMQIGGLTLDNLRELGLAKLGVSQDKKTPYIRYTLSYETLKEAVATLRTNGNFKAAEALERPLLEIQKRRMLQAAVREAEEAANNAANAGEEPGATNAPKESATVNADAEVVNEAEGAGTTPESATANADEPEVAGATVGGRPELEDVPEKTHKGKTRNDDERPRRGGRKQKFEPTIEKGLEEV